MNKNNKDNLQIELAISVGIIASRFGLSHTAGQIYGLLYMSPKPVSLNEMVEKLGISKGSASTNVRSLESWGAVKKVWIKGSRRDFYEAELDTLNIVLKRAKIAIKKRLGNDNDDFTTFKDNIKKIDSENLTEEEKELLTIYKERLSRIKEMKNKVMSLLEILPEEIP